MSLENPRVQAKISHQLLREGDGWHSNNATSASVGYVVAKIFRPNASLFRRACLLADANFLSREFFWTHQLKVFSASKNRLPERWRAP